MIKARENIFRQLQYAITSRETMMTTTRSPMHWSLAHALYRANFVSWVTQGGPHRPDASIIATHSPEELAKMTLWWTAKASKLQLWLGLKHQDNIPVMRTVKPIRNETANLEELHRLASGVDVGRLEGLAEGECIFLQTDDGVLEAREALEKSVEGRLLCRISPLVAKDREKVANSHERPDAQVDIPRAEDATNGVQQSPGQEPARHFL
ncbi:hypothetical protein BJ170DRAFT_622875 [Xylariales sp. AK1849]|nr:hypothetical protein BJ170DRAFT_622875 [Xylariales sp. AK1849]